MEEIIPSPEASASESASAYELLILHTDEAQEWAAYLQQILTSSQNFPRGSVVLYAVSAADRLHGYNFEDFLRCRCVVLILSAVFLDVLRDPELHGALQRLLRPPRGVVALLCGVSEEDVSTETFEDWSSWRKLHADDEPAAYVSTILDSITDSQEAEAEPKMTERLAAEEEEDEQNQTEPKDEESTAAAEDPTSSPADLSCLTVQPNRVLCGEHQTLYVILTSEVDFGSEPEVEFSSEDVYLKRIPAAVENEYTVSVCAPDMPAGEASLTLITDRCRVRLKTVRFYTEMEEVNRHLEKAADPLKFICQAFDFTSDSTESLDAMLTDSLKSRTPAGGLQLFGVAQIEERNMSAYQRNEELPTMLHFAAKFGLKKLTSALLQSPGALQACSVMNRSGDYPNTLAEKSGFTALRRLMDRFVETGDTLASPSEDSTNLQDEVEVYEPMSSQDIMDTEKTLKSQFEDAMNLQNDDELYEPMLTSSKDIMTFAGCSEDIYESMVGIDPECAEDLYEMMTAADENPEEAMLRKFFQARPNTTDVNSVPPKRQETVRHERTNFDEIEEEEDPYNLCPEDIYDTVDINSTYPPAVLNRPPAPIPRPESESEPEKPTTYISRVFSDKSSSQSKTMEPGYFSARAVGEALTPAYDPYAGMKTPGQRQLISLQERVKVGDISVDEAVQEFKAWQVDHERRASSIRFQQDNLDKLRKSITRRHKEREKAGGESEYEISAPLQRNMYWGSALTLECDVYEPAPRMVAVPPPAAPPILRGNWKTGSTSSTSSTESNRLSVHSSYSCSSGTEPEFEDVVESLPPPPRPPRPSDAAPLVPPPRIPPRIPERVPEVIHERYISCPTRALPLRPSHRQTDSAPPPPRRLR
ncbi:phosphoinositide 3-kinase adapter protein 1 [Kryptolebias marmoratus]|uniref:Phosphoinositide-3-kinase adaptor protein 1 n=1 Tax=Kryptolebias marmoratus TaxID=37003 RepID=A0A3Q3F9C7_KRYMA|nr:phosphoinositide 3-kinase adapter protein 1 [Kryptolebias marmoratus]XP_017279707.1 phosphoinositide 3-kinase adapter protein 1 [Kryptolebias marmoratus]XP_037829532.1 phosphoinositide 3-kinase adapter protein 1 [Kryptolebias marmoratus]